jgi:osmotically-inducible protein OsmY
MLLTLSGISMPGQSAPPAEEQASSGASRDAGSILEDAALTGRIKMALAAAGAGSVQVATQGGIVQLSGFVDHPQDAERALEVARQVKGVREVYNDIRVLPESG